MLTSEMASKLAIVRSIPTNNGSPEKQINVIDLTLKRNIQNETLISKLVLNNKILRLVEFGIITIH